MDFWLRGHESSSLTPLLPRINIQCPRCWHKAWLGENLRGQLNSIQ